MKKSFAFHLILLCQMDGFFFIIACLGRKIALEIQIAIETETLNFVMKSKTNWSRVINIQFFCSILSSLILETHVYFRLVLANKWID